VAKDLNNIWTYVGILTIVLIFTTLIANIGADLVESEEANLNQESINYLGNLTGSSNYANFTSVDSSGLDGDLGYEDEEDGNVSDGSNAKDFAIGFFYAQQQWAKIKRIVYVVARFPTFIIQDLLNLDVGNWKPFLAILDILFSLGLVISAVYFFRGIAR